MHPLLRGGCLITIVLSTTTKAMVFSSFRQFSTLVLSNPNSFLKQPIIIPFSQKGIWNPIPIPHRTIPEPKGQDLDFINVAYSHLVHSDWPKLAALSNSLTPFRVNHILLKTRKDYVLSLEFFNWVQSRKPDFHTLDTVSIMLHILTKCRKFKSAESILKKVISSGSIDFPTRLYESILYSYRLCDSSPRVFDSLFKTYAHLKKFRNATDTFSRMKEYGFLPTVESCNAYMSSLISLNRADIGLAFYREMRRHRISPNVYTINMVMCAFCKLEKVEKAVEVFSEMEIMGVSRNVVSYNTLIAGYCSKGLLSSAMKLKNSMVKDGINPNVVTFNTIINGLCKEDKLHEANKIFSEMKQMDVAPNDVTYNTLINGYSKVGNSEMGNKLFEEMSRNGIKANILTYNALILGLCKEGKTKKAAYVVKNLDKENLIINSSTFSALIRGQCVRKNSDRAFQLYKTMVRSGCHPNDQTLKMLMSTFCTNEDFHGAVEMLREMYERHFTPDLGVLLGLCNGLNQQGKCELVVKLCNEMETRRLVPEGFDKAKLVSRPGHNEKQNEDNM